MHPTQFGLARFMTSVALVSLLLNPWSHPGITRTKRPWLQGFRSLLLLGSTALAQHVPELASLDDPNQIVWQQTLNHDVTGALRWVEQPGERTLLLVHTTVDQALVDHTAV